jgi:hypothetical protein
MRPLWRALALAWLGGVGSPALMDDPPSAAPTEIQHEAAIPPLASPGPIAKPLSRHPGESGANGLPLSR